MSSKNLPKLSTSTSTKSSLSIRDDSSSHNDGSPTRFSAAVAAKIEDIGRAQAAKRPDSTWDKPKLVELRRGKDGRMKSTQLADPSPKELEAYRTIERLELELKVARGVIEAQKLQFAKASSARDDIGGGVKADQKFPARGDSKAWMNDTDGLDAKLETRKFTLNFYLVLLVY